MQRGSCVRGTSTALLYVPQVCPPPPRCGRSGGLLFPWQTVFLVRRRPSAVTTATTPLSRALMQRVRFCSTGPSDGAEVLPPPSSPSPPAAIPLSEPPSGSRPLRQKSATTEDATSRWVSCRKPNGEQRMSIFIRSESQRRLARRAHTSLPNAPSEASINVVSTRSDGCSSLSSSARKESASSMKRSSNVGRGVALTAPSLLSNLTTFDCEDECMRCDPPAPAAPTSSSLMTSSPAFSALNPLEGACSATSSTEEGITNDANRMSNSSNSEPCGDVVSMTTGSETRHADDHCTSRPSGDDSSSSSSPPYSPFFPMSRFAEPVKRIILIRNGRSEAYEDASVYVRIPDWRISLVEEGKCEAIAAGRALSDLVGSDPVYFYYSPYVRSRQTLRYVLQGYDEARLSGAAKSRRWWEEEEETASSLPFSAEECAEETNGAAWSDKTGTAAKECNKEQWQPVNTRGVRDYPWSEGRHLLRPDPSLVLNSGTSSSIIGVREDVRLRDGDVGRYTSTAELMHHLLERERYGKFFYRFPFGESGADVCDRVTSFLDSFQRERVEFPMDTNVVIITHGLTMRMFIKRWYHLTVDTFHKMRSPPSGSLCTLTRLHHRSCFRLDESCVESMHLPLSLNEFNGYKYRNKRLLGSMSSGAPYM